MSGASNPFSAVGALDTENWDEEIKAGPDEAIVRLDPVGPTRRPNGQMYTPRFLGPHEDIAFLRHCRRSKEHILFSGPPGTGKSALSEASFPDGFETLFCSADTTEMDIVGGFQQDPKDPLRFVWVNGPFIESLVRGVPFVIEEVALADPRVLSAIYPAMDGRSWVEVNANRSLGRIPVPDQWCVVASYNPDVPGASMSEALLDRFDHCVEVGTDWALALHLGIGQEIIKAAQVLDDHRRRGTLTWSPQLRALLAFEKARKSHGLQYAVSNLISKAPRGEQARVAAEVEAVFPGTALESGAGQNGGREPSPKPLRLGKQFR